GSGCLQTRVNYLFFRIFHIEADHAPPLVIGLFVPMVAKLRLAHPFWSKQINQHSTRQSALYNPLSLFSRNTLQGVRKYTHAIGALCLLLFVNWFWVRAFLFCQLLNHLSSGILNTSCALTVEGKTPIVAEDEVGCGAVLPNVR